MYRGIQSWWFVARATVSELASATSQSIRQLRISCPTVTPNSESVSGAQTLMSSATC